MKTIVRFCVLICWAAITSCTQMGWEGKYNTIVRYSIKNDTERLLLLKNGDNKEIKLHINNAIILYSKDRGILVPTPLLKPGDCKNDSFSYSPGLGETFTVNDGMGNVMAVWHQDSVYDEPYSIYDSKNWEVSSSYIQNSDMKDYPTIEWTFSITPEMLGL